MQPLFVTSGFLPKDEHIALQLPLFSELPAFLRVLLTTDGTVTKSLESYFWEPVEVVAQEQKELILPTDLPAINMMRGECVWQRKVILVGEGSQKHYALADSNICMSRLPRDMQQALKDGEIGIGGFLRQCGAETYRQIIDVGQSNHVSLGKVVWRTYRIVMNQQPLMTITETFPLAQYV